MKKFLTKRNLILIFILFSVLTYLGYSKFFKRGSDEYILDKVKRGDLEISISGSGYIEPVKELELKSKVSDEVIYVNAKEGDYVQAGQIIAKFNTRNIEKAISDQEINIKNLEIALELAKNNLEKFDQEYQQVLKGDNYQKALNQGKKILNSFYPFYPDFLEGLRKIYFEKELDQNYNNLRYYENYDQKFKGKSQILEEKYNQVKNDYLNLSNKFNNLDLQKDDEVESLIKNTQELVKNSYDLVNEGREMIRYLKEKLILTGSTHTQQQIVENHWQKLTDYLNKLEEYKTNLLDVISKIEDYHDLINNYNFERKNLELTIKQKEVDLEAAKKKLNDLKEELNDYFVVSPFSGILKELNIKENDFVGANFTVGVLSTNQKIAKVDLNEVDVAKVKIGDLAYLTFDALPDLQIKGKVYEISSKAKVDQNVVSYEVKIFLEEDNENIKDGMSVNAEIIVEKKENILVVPNNAIKNDEQGEYVEVVKINWFRSRIRDLDENLIEKRYIKTGLSNENFTEIREGLKEGEIIIVRKILSQNNQRQTQNNPFLPRMPFGSQRR